METVLIAGCGYVGTELAARLAASGTRVIALRRSTATMPPGVQSIAADLADPATLRNLPASITAVVYTAGSDSSDEAAYRRAYVNGLANLLAAFAGRPLRRVLFTSSTSVYGQSNGEWVDETSETTPADFRGHTLLEAERLLTHLPCESAAVRFGGIYGPGRTRLIDSVRSGQASLAPGAQAYTNRIHRDDCAGVLAHLLAVPVLHPLYVAVDCAPAPMNDVLTFLAAQLGREPLATASAAPPRRAGSRRCSNARLLASGYTFQFPTFREGYAKLIADASAFTSPDHQGGVRM